MKTRIFNRLVIGISLLAVIIFVSSCELMESSKKSFESVAVEDEEVSPHIMEPVEYDYVTSGHERHKLDYYKYFGETEVTRPTLIWIHGGGWITGDKSVINILAFEVANQGKYNLISINYRLANDESAPWPGIVHDVNAAIRWIKMNSTKLGLDPDKLILAGESAGAHLAAMAAFGSNAEELEGDKNPGIPTDVRAVILFFGAYNMSSLVVQKNSAIRSGMCETIQYPSPILELLDCPDSAKGEYNIDSCDLKKVRTADPCAYVDKSDPPAFIAHGQHDCTVPWGQSKALHDELEDVGVRNVFISAEDGEHSISTLGIKPEDIVAFIQESLVDEKESISDADGPSVPDKQ